MALHSDDNHLDALAKLFADEIQESIERQATQLAIMHYGPCTGPGCEACEATKPEPLPRRVRMWRWVKAWCWFRPWGFVHRVIPGECRCQECEDGEWY